MARRYKQRRGIVILVVLSLLVLFVLLAVTYAIIAGLYQRSAEAHAEEELLGIDPQKDLEKGFDHVVLGTAHTGSAARYHELLRDMYGEDGFRGRLIDSNTLQVWNESANPNAGYRLSGGQFVDLIADMSYDWDNDGSNGLQPLLSTDGQNYTINHTSGYYNGCVLTITGGEAQDISTRIVGYLWHSGASRPVFRVMALKSDDGTAISWTGLGEVSFVVNGRQFSGTGFGYNTQPAGQAKLDQRYRDPTTGTLTTLELALLPNHATWVGDNVTRLLKGGSDEGYDAADFQNMAMAIIQTRPGGVVDRMPSFHRPTLVRYWRNREQTLWQNDISDDFKRLFILRPIEPNFDGSNPDYFPPPIDWGASPPTVGLGQSWYETGPWDVDNDGDGVRDSIWIDLGLPVQTAADGRKYKPLFAIMCRDMDGRLNVNAHGRIAVYDFAPPAGANDGQNPPLYYRKGLGYGPPEIDLRWAGVTGNVAGLLATRYGSDGRPGQANSYEQLARIRFFEEPKNYNYTTGARSSYSSPPDLRAELAFGVNASGQPQFEQLPNANVETRWDSAYELNLLGGSTGDDPYTPAELERILRRYDYDRYLLPDRLANYITDASLVTTNSFDVPVPSISAPAELVNYINDTLTDADTTNDLSLHNAMDLLVARLQSRGITDPAVRQAQLAKMLSPDLVMGLRFDLNRPFGNARDGSTSGGAGQGTVDEAALPTANTELQNEQLYSGDNDLGAARTEFDNVWMWHNNGFIEFDTDGNGHLDDLDGDGNGNDGTSDAQDWALSHLFARQRYARHLYVLMLTLMDHGDTGGIPNAPTQAAAKEAAQWAINVVDFRDADSIMTPFEYDENPFNRWHVDGDLTTTGETDRAVVWGCERPELLLTEAIGFHARRTRDAQNDTTGSNHDQGNGDPHYDQEHVPFASAFIELYNPWNGADTTATPPQELYGGAGGVQLNRTTPGANPVWRLMIVNRTDHTTIDSNTHNPDDYSGGNTRDRVVYFVSTLANAPGATGDHGLRRYYTNQPVAPIPPGQHAVVGGGMNIAGEWVSPVGDIDTINNPGVTDGRRVVLVPDATFANNQVRVHQGNGQLPDTAQAVAIVANLSDVPSTQIRTAFSVSEPRDGYPITVGAAQFNANAVGVPPPAAVAYDYNAIYEESAVPGTALPVDEPLDRRDPQFRDEVGRRDGTTRTFCRVYLQRLADPLRNYDTQSNPYRTIDSISMDLTVFNGLETDTFPTGDTDVGSTGVDFSCLQRGDTDDTTSVREARRLWSQELRRQGAGTHAPADTIHAFPYNLDPHTLGSMNDGYEGPPFTFTATKPTFPWLVWNNRPFVSPYELMHVPRFNCWDVLKTTNIQSNFTLPSGDPPYDNTAPQYGHMLNFFHAVSSGPRAPHYYRIFDYVHVPSRFVGTDTVLNPNYFGTTTNFAQPNSVSQGFLPPFNRVSKYRIPGLVNINTIPNAAVWNAIRGPHIRSGAAVYDGPGYSAIFNSREDGAASDVTLPTWFANPFRPMGSRDLVPISRLTEDSSGTLLDGIETTLLRPNSSDTPLMEISNIVVPPIRHTRNSFFRYELLHRLGNMVTTRSNVYAIWITVGYFEMEPNYNASGQVTYDMSHPEGLRVGQEMGIDTGAIRRHRAFYMIDRTIPVAFEPGQNHNVDKCVLVRRFIE